MKAKSGKTDLPQIFINGKYIGVRESSILFRFFCFLAGSWTCDQGYNELQALEEDEKLNDLLATPPPAE